MVKSNFSLGTILLTIVLTIVIFIGAIAGTLIAVYKTVKVSTITGLFGDTEWISSEYDGTIEEVVKKVSDALSGEINIDTLAEISPAIGDFADQLVDNIENNGLFKVDRERLYSTNFSQLTANLTEMLVITASLNDLSEQFSFDLPDLDIITGNAESPLLVYTQVNDNEAGTIDKVFDSKYAAEPYTFYTRAESFVSEYTDDAGARQPITVKSTETLYTLEGVDTQSGYLKRSADGATLYLQTETDNDSIPFVYTPMTENNGAVYAVNGNKVTFALAANEKIVTRTGPDGETDYATVDLGSAQGEVTAYEVAAPYRYTPLYSEKAQAPEGGSPMGDVPKTGDYYEADGKYYVLVTQTDGSGNYVADTENGGFAVAEGYTEETLFALEYVYTEADAAAANADTALYVETDGIGGLPVTYALTAFSRVFDMDEMTLADVGTYFGVDLSNDMLDAVRYVPMGYLSDSMGAEMNGIYVKDVLDITPDSSALLRTLAYGEEGVDYRIEGDEFVMIGNAEPKTIGALSAGLDELKISSVVDIVTEEEATDDNPASHPLMQAIADWTLTDFSDPAKIGSLTIGQVIDIVTEEEATDDNPASPKILQLLADVPIDGKELSAAIDGFTLGEILGEEATSDGFLALLKNSTLDSLSDDLKNLTVQQMFADNIYGYHVVAQLDTTTEQATFERLQALYDQTKDAYNGLLYVYVNGKTMTFEEYRAAYKTADNPTGTITAVPSQLLSPYILITDANRGDYSNVPLYMFSDGEYVLATAVTGWQLPNNGEPQGATYYTDREGKNPATPGTDGHYTVDTLYRWDIATETMKKVSLLPAAYGLTAEGQAAGRLYSRLLFAGTYNNDYEFKNGNLFYYDIQKDGWVQVPLQVTNGEYALAGDFDPAVIAGKNLYTYGTPVGAWKYLVTQDGKETSCPVQDIGSLMSNVQANISSLTLRDLYDDGMVNISAPDGKTPEEMLDTPITVGEKSYKIGDLTLDGMINIIYGIASGNINIGTTTP